MPISLSVTVPEAIDDSPAGQGESLQQRVEHLLQTANEHYQRQDFRAAREDLAALEPLQAHTTETLQTVGNLSLLLGQPEVAGGAFRRALALQPGNVSLLIALAVVDMRLQSDPNCNGFLQRALELEPDNPDALKLLADTNLTYGQYRDAVRIYERLIDRHPNQLEIFLALAKSHFELGDKARTRSALQRVLDLDPANQTARENLAALDAKAATAAPLSTANQDPATQVPPAVARLLTQADTAYSRGDLFSASELLKHAVEFAPNFVPIRVCLANIQFQLNQYAAALATYEYARNLEPNNLDVLVRLAATALRCGNSELFEQSLGRALQLDPEYVPAVRLLADTNFKNQQYLDAARQYQRLLEKAPNASELLLPLGACLYKLGQTPLARQCFERVLNIDPANQTARENLTQLALEDTRRELAQAYEHHNGSYYLAPFDLKVGRSSLRRWLLVGSCVAEKWRPDWELQGGCPGDFVLTNNLAELPSEPPSPVTEYDFQVIQIPIRSILADDAAFWKIPYDDQDAHAVLFQESCARLERQLAQQMAWNIKYGLMTFVTNFLVPQQNPMGRLLPRYDYRNPVYFIEKLNEFLYAKVAAYKNAHVLDLDRISATFGRKYVQEDGVGWLAHGAYLPESRADRDRVQPAPAVSEYYPGALDVAVGAVWAEVIAMYRTLRQIDPVKLVVVDLDYTLWRGVLGEQADPGREMLEAPHWNWPMGMIEALGFLKKRGILLAVISKNDESVVRKSWPKIIGSLLALDQFAALRVNWRPKAENMREILHQTNLLPRNVVFVDDNPVERAAMQAAFPDLRVLSGLHLYWKRNLLWSAETQTASISKESARRTEMVRAQVARESQRQALSREEFLASLNLGTEMFCVRSPEDPKFVRAFELLNKTNQFNTTGKRWREEECRAGFAQGCTFHVFTATDKFCDYGLVGGVVRKGSHLEQFVMSCRVVGLDLELAVLAALAEAARAEGFTSLTASLARTDANFLCQDLFRRAGFTEKDGVWELVNLSSLRPPPHVALTARTVALTGAGQSHWPRVSEGQAGRGALQGCCC